MTTTRTPNTAGRRAEGVAARLARYLGWRILATRETAERGSGAGEIDIIAARESVIAMIEVKTRETAVEAIEAVTTAQRQRLEKGAAAWLARHPEAVDATIRFDVIAVPRFGLPLWLEDAWRPQNED